MIIHLFELNNDTKYNNTILSIMRRMGWNPIRTSSINYYVWIPKRDKFLWEFLEKKFFEGVEET